MDELLSVSPPRAAKTVAWQAEIQRRGQPRVARLRRGREPVDLPARREAHGAPVLRVALDAARCALAAATPFAPAAWAETLGAMAPAERRVPARAMEGRLALARARLREAASRTPAAASDVYARRSSRRTQVARGTPSPCAER